MTCGHEIAWYDNVPRPLVAAAARTLPLVRRADPARYPAVELVTALLVAGCVWKFGAPRRGARRRRSSASRSSRSRRPTSSTGSSRTGSSCPPRRSCSSRRPRSTRRPSGRSRALGASGFLFARRARLSGRHGDGRREARAAARRDARARRSPVAMMLGMVAALVPAVVLLARHGAAARKMKIPFGPFLALGGVVALFCGPRSSSTLLVAVPCIGRSRANARRAAVPIPRSRDRRDATQNAGTGAVEPRRCRAAAGRAPAPLGRPARLGLGLGGQATASRASSCSSTCSRRPASSRRTSSRSRAAAPAQTGSFSQRARRRGPRVERGRRAHARRAAPPAARRPRGDRRRRRGREAHPAATCSSASSRSRTRSTATSCASRSPTRRTSTGIDELRLATRHQIEFGVALARRHRSPSCAGSAAPSRRSSSREDALVAIVERGGARATRRRPRGRRRHLRRAARPARQLDHLPGGRGRRQRHPLRAAGGRAHRPLPDRRRAARGAADPEAALAPGVTTRLKVLAKLDIAERRKPQDGRISLNAAAAGRMLDIRVATLPTVEGESVVMRLLDKSRRRRRSRSSASRTTMRDAAARDHPPGRPARCSSPARPAPASRRRSTRRSPRSTGPRSTSSRSRTRSSTGSPASTRCRSTSAPA